MHTQDNMNRFLRNGLSDHPHASISKLLKGILPGSGKEIAEENNTCEQPEFLSKPCPNHRFPKSGVDAERCRPILLDLFKSFLAHCALVRIHPLEIWLHLERGGRIGEMSIHWLARQNSAKIIGDGDGGGSGSEKEDRFFGGRSGKTVVGANEFNFGLKTEITADILLLQRS